MGSVTPRLRSKHWNARPPSSNALHWCIPSAHALHRQAENADPMGGRRLNDAVMRVQPFRLRIIYEARATRDDPELNVRHATRNAAQDAVAWGRR